LEFRSLNIKTRINSVNLKKLLIILFTLFSTYSFAQKPKVQNDPGHDYKLIHFGFTVGFNTMDFRVSHSEKAYDSIYADVSKLSPGFHIQIVSNLRLAEYFDLRFLPGISFGQRYLKYINDSDEISEMKIESSFIEFPLLLKYKAKRLNNYRPYLIGGLNMRIDMAARREYDEEDRIYIRLKQYDLYYEAGFGIDFYLPHFKLTTELKLAVGIRNILNPVPDASNPYFTIAIDRLTSTLVFLSFHFE